MYSKSYIPYKGYYCSPFARWQGSLQNENSIEIGSATAKKWLAKKNINPEMFDYFILGKTVGQQHTFYAATWAAAMVGAERIPGLHISQACSTGTTCINQAVLGIEQGLYNNVFCLMTDRTSNAPHTIWPNSMGMGGQVVAENWMLDNFNSDPWVGLPMIQTAENVAQQYVKGLTKEFCDEVTLRRYEQYLDSVANDREFQKRYMFPVEYKKTKREVGIVDADEGITPSSKEGLAKLRPVLEGGVHTYASQTHPADGNASIIITTREQAKELSVDPNIEIQVISYGYSRAPKGFMGLAPVPAAEMALQNAGINVKKIKSIKTHNPFIVNDIYMAKQMGIDPMSFNNYGSSMIFGHPQGPTASRSIIEMIEELVLLGGGYGLYTGCAAGDTGAALILKVG